MNNLYMFRNTLSGKVISSLEHRLQNTHLSQIGEQRNGLVLRRDHWIPFAVLTGISTPQLCEDIYKQLKTEFKSPIGKTRLPLPLMQTIGWKIPEPVKDTTIKLCKILSLLKVTPENNWTMHWERDEFRHVIQSENMMWPWFVQHQKLAIQGNSVPIVPGVQLIAPKKAKSVPERQETLIY